MSRRDDDNDNFRMKKTITVCNYDTKQYDALHFIVAMRQFAWNSNVVHINSSTVTVSRFEDATKGSLPPLK